MITATTVEDLHDHGGCVERGPGRTTQEAHVAQVLHLTGPVLLGPGPDDVVGELWVLDGRVSRSRPGGDHDVTRLDGWVLPGLVDAHCHIGLGPDGAVDDETALAQAVADRDAGVLAVRDAGSPADTRWLQERDDVPRIVRAGRHVARTRRYLRGFAEEVEPEDLAATVTRQARRGDGWVKVVGDWIDRDLGDLAPCWPRKALEAAVAAAHVEGARITAHVFGEDALPDLLEAGFDGLEHACGLTPETTALAAQRGVAVVPTLVNIATFPSIAARGEAKFPTYAAHMRALHARRRETVAAAHEAGVPVFTGTDAGSVMPHGLLPQEVAELVAAGLSPRAALDAACWGARRWLGMPDLEEGASADCVVLPADPREDVGVLAAPRAVVLRGARAGGPSAAARA